MAKDTCTRSADGANADTCTSAFNEEDARRAARNGRVRAIIMVYGRSRGQRAGGEEETGEKVSEASESKINVESEGLLQPENQAGGPGTVSLAKQRPPRARLLLLT